MLGELWNAPGAAAGGLVKPKAMTPCARHEEPDLWFSPVPGDIAEAKAECGVCPVLWQCHVAAVEGREEWGVWGGLSAAERRGIWRARHRRAREAAS